MTTAFALPIYQIQEFFSSTLFIICATVFIGVLISDLIGNQIAFGQRFLNALVTAAVATALVFGASVLLREIMNWETLDGIRVFLPVFVGVFISDLIGNVITFGNRFTNAFVTAVVATIIVIVLLYVFADNLFVF